MRTHTELRRMCWRGHLWEFLGQKGNGWIATRFEISIAVLHTRAFVSRLPASYVTREICVNLFPYRSTENVIYYYLYWVSYCLCSTWGACVWAASTHSSASTFFSFLLLFRKNTLTHTHTCEKMKSTVQSLIAHPPAPAHMRPMPTENKKKKRK